MSQQTLKAQIDGFLAEMVKNAPPEAMQTILAEIGKLVDGGLAKALAVGAAAPEFTLKDAAGKPVSLRALWARGPVVVKFNRGTWCPFCDLELKATSDALKTLNGAATLVVIMPQAPDKVAQAIQGRDYGFQILHDAGSAVARQFGVAFSLPEPLRPIYTAFDMDVSLWNGDGSWTLPFPSTFVVDGAGRIAWSRVEANWTVRPEPAEVLAAAQRAARPS